MVMHRSLLTVAVLALLMTSLFAFSPQSVSAECGVYHTVLRGQNLFRISLRYNVSIREIAAANNISDVSRIYAGQQLYIPCASGTTGTSGSASAATATAATSGATGATGSQTVTIPASTTVDCQGFAATSPLDGFPDGNVTFYWNMPASGSQVTHYQVIVFDDRGRRVGFFETAGGFSSIRGDVSFNAIGGRSRFSWIVLALVHGVEACRTQTTTLNRTWNADAGLSPN